MPLKLQLSGILKVDCYAMQFILVRRIGVLCAFQTGNLFHAYLQICYTICICMRLWSFLIAQLINSKWFSYHREGFFSDFAEIFFWETIVVYKDMALDTLTSHSSIEALANPNADNPLGDFPMHFMFITFTVQLQVSSQILQCDMRIPNYPK